jgi:NAD(P)-dependent dehydrogenase (short-subunit alcohol dehydrogenase family)
MSLAAQRVVIIGGTSGIGLAAAKLFSSRGARVAIVGRDGEKLAAALREIGPPAEGVAANASDRAALDALFAKLAPIDHLVIAASGGKGAGAFAKLDGAELERGFQAKFWTHWNAAQSALPHISAEGSITFVTAASSRLANPGTSGLAAINGAIERITPTLARELAPLRVNAVSPGVIDTPWWADKPAGMFEAASRARPAGAGRRGGRRDRISRGQPFRHRHRARRLRRPPRLESAHLT